MGHVRTFGLGHVQIGVADVQRSLDFYTRSLGLERRGEADGRYHFLGTQGCVDNLTIAPAVGAGPSVDHFGFMLQDAPRELDATLRRIEAAGGNVVERFELFPGWPTAVFVDPDGFRVQI